MYIVFGLWIEQYGQICVVHYPVDISGSLIPYVRTVHEYKSLIPAVVVLTLHLQRVCRAHDLYYIAVSLGETYRKRVAQCSLEVVRVGVEFEDAESGLGVRADLFESVIERDRVVHHAVGILACLRPEVHVKVHRSALRFCILEYLFLSVQICYS